MQVASEHNFSERRIGGLRPHIVAQEEWILRRWYSHTPLWYYHLRQPLASLNRTKRFYRRVDPDLRVLCEMLHGRGIYTGPSCQGHFHSRDHFQRVWEQMRMEEDAIRNTGLSVTNSETSEACTFQDPGFELPWSHFDDFYDEVAAHQSSGYLSVALTNDEGPLHAKLARKAIDGRTISTELDQFLSDRLHAPLLHVRVKAHDPSERGTAWQEVAALFEHL